MRILLNVLLAMVPVVLMAQLTPKMLDGPRGNIGFYQYLPPDYSAKGEKKPLIIFLHGIGEKGTGTPKELEKIVCCGIPKYIHEGHDMQFTWNGKTEGFVVLAPQLYSRYGTWENYFIDAMFKYASDHLNIDSNRIFLTGMSLGGGGTWVYASASLANARKFAGIVPVVSPCFMGNGCNIANANLPVYTIHAADDNVARYLCTENAVKSIIECGARAIPNVVKYETGGHFIWRERAYNPKHDYFNPNTFEWMLAQNRLFKPNIKPLANAGKDITISSTPGHIILDGSASSDPDGKIVRYSWRKSQGPPYGILTEEDTPHPVIKGLTFPGVYTFELRAIDDRAEWSVDSVKVTVVDGNVIN
jgi:dienelactone hydrolase